MSHISSNLLLRTASGLSILAALTLTASAQDQQNATVLETITVTGERMVRSIFDTASSVTVVTEEELEKNVQENTAKDVLNDIPNVFVPNTVGAGTIRGQAIEGPNTGATAFYGGTVPRATINVDGRYISFNELYFGDTSVWDVGAMEVFRGPQTTSQGANSIAGAIIINTNDPTWTPEASIQGSVSSNEGRRLSLMASGPLIQDELAGRLALDFYGRDSIIDFVNPAFDPGDADPNISVKNGRGKLLWKPSAIPGLEAKFTYSHTESNGPQSESIPYPFNGYESNSTAVVSWDNKTDTGILDLSYEMENGVTLFNQTQYSVSDIRRLYNPSDNGSAEIDQTDFSNETRATFEAMDGRLTGVAGAFYRNVKADEALHFLGGIDFRDSKESLGIYSELTYRLTDKWSVTGGLRYQRDTMTRTGSYAGTPVSFDGTFDDILPKISVSYNITPDLTVGALVNRGYNPGGVSLDTTREMFVPFRKETVWNYELFSRASLLDGDLILTGNLFYSDFRDAHRYSRTYIPELDLQTSATLNADRAHSYGVELGATWSVSDSLRLNGSLGLLRTKITKFTDSSADFEGNEFAKSPGYMIGFGFDWDITERWNFGGNIRHVDGYFSDDANTVAYAVEPYTVANVNMSYRPKDNIKIFGYVKNIFDERAATSIGGRGSVISASIVQPRTFGAGMRVDF
ncbi:TonB-dependent siderophore receptor [Nitratireductor indicus C115]|uniref:TonB-dependent siderophore receptor n=1 Tax=Nitratireductor indicus C115 TaxID=1231190 RepID=K2NV46_9HYPH|nr:TonB-dependent receptor [Nitratireductor indicus]EKF43190.1 TonB-dependent siderophore receptor [Nitratireductor indicus C115]SFQ53541.1 Outer membrane receptor proteins, mostly Fe transport [Nitratireductor indicus]